MSKRIRLPCWRIYTLVFIANCTGALLTGCSSVKSFSSAGAVAPADAVTTIALSFDPVLPRWIEVSRMSEYGLLKVSEQDKQRAQKDSAALTLAVRDAFFKRFPAMAANHGLTVKSDAGGTTVLRVRVTSLSLGCTSLGCMPELELRGDLIRPKESTSYWNFSSKVGTANVMKPITDDIFNEFALKLLEAMEKDRVIRKD